jgi:hypothetical protein
VSSLLERRKIGWREVVAIAEVGSTAHGIALEGTDDLDLTIVRAEPFAELVVGAESRQSMMIRTQPEGFRSRMGDIDLQVYTARKFARLALGGNPSILNVLYVPSYHYERQDWRNLRKGLQGLTPSKRAGNAFLGYMRQQTERWQGLRGQKNVSRPELVEAYGFDTKYAAHIVRLGFQGATFMREARIPIPLPDDFAKRIVNLRTGGMTEAAALEWAREVENDLHRSILESPLPEGPNVAGTDSLLVDFYRTDTQPVSKEGTE